MRPPPSSASTSAPASSSMRAVPCCPCPAARWSAVDPSCWLAVMSAPAGAGSTERTACAAPSVSHTERDGEKRGRGTSVEQHPHDPFEALVCGKKQSCPAIGCLRRHFRAASEKPPDLLGISHLRRLHEWRLDVLARTSRTSRHCAGKQRSSNRRTRSEFHTNNEGEVLTPHLVRLRKNAIHLQPVTDRFRVLYATRGRGRTALELSAWADRRGTVPAGQAGNCPRHSK